MITVRPYQQEALDAVWQYLATKPGNPCVELPTGSGKTPVLVALARQAVLQWNGRVLILAHVKELLQQAADKFLEWWPDATPDIVGVYSAGLKRRDTDTPILIAGIQSVFRRATELGAFDLVIIDEAHLVPTDGDGMYRKLIADLRIMNPNVRIIGLTATPYRLDCGLICGPGNVLTDICYAAPVRALIDQGHLSKLRGKQGHEADVSGVHSRGGDYIAGELEAACSDSETVALACDDIIKHCAERRAWVIFCVGVKHATMVSAALAERGVNAPIITAETPSSERDALIASFKAGTIRALCNINVLAIGFDAPHIDAVIMLRPTQSPGLYYQQVGRGLRKHPGKTDCLVLDLAGNVREHGPIDLIEPGKPKAKGDAVGDAPTRTCPQCAEILPLAAPVCPGCGYAFPPPPIAKHATQAEDIAPLAETKEETFDVLDISYQPWTKKGAPKDAPQTLMVEYSIGRFNQVREWVCVEHTGYAKTKALAWWNARSDEPVPASAALAAAMGTDGELKEPTQIVIRYGGRFPEIIKHLFTSPCSSCKFLMDANHCGKWERDVPTDWVERGCDQHEKVVATTASYVPADDDQPPF